MADGLDLEQVYKDQDAAFYIDNGVKRGIARRFVSGIGTWAKQQSFWDVDGWFEDMYYIYVLRLFNVKPSVVKMSCCT